jgi:O-antigen/teichoic acid export membrane protein
MSAQKGLASAAATRLGRHALVYGAGAVIPFVVGMLNVVVLTRFIAPGAFGQLAVLLIFAASLTILYTLGTLQGTFRLVFGVDGEMESDERKEVVTTSAKDRLLGTGVALTALIGLAGTAAVAAAAKPLTHLLFLDESQAGLVVLAAAGGALGSIWRILVNVPRLERKPKTYAALNAVRPLLVVAISVTLVALGAGIEGVLSGISIGTLLAVVVAFAVLRRSIAPAFHVEHVRTILGAGVTFLPLILSAWVVHNVDVYIVAGMASDADAGLYRVASRIAAVVSFALGFFMMAWVPLRRTSLFKALEGEARNGWFNATMATYFFVVCMGLLVVLGVAAQLLVRVAGPAYADAAALIPLLGLGLIAYGCFVMIARIVKMRGRGRAYIGFAIAAAVTFVIAALLLTPPFGAQGTALAPVIAYGVGIAGIVTMAARASGLPAIRWRKIAISAAAAAACIGSAVFLAPLAGDLTPLADLLAILAYPVVVLAAGVVDREHMEPLKRIFRTIAAPRQAELSGLRQALIALAPDDRSLLESLLRRRDPPADVARRLGRADDELHQRFTGVLRRLADVPGDGTRDAEIAAYLLSGATVADRDAMAHRLWSSDIEPGELHALEAVAAALVGEDLWQEQNGAQPTSNPSSVAY